MVSWTGHILPVLVTIAVWFLATGLIAWLDNRDRTTFPRSLVITGLAALVGLGAFLVGGVIDGIAGVYLAFAGALLIWAWHEFAFLTGAVAGPRRTDCPANARGFRRFVLATGTVIHHEIALAVTALGLWALAWNTATTIGASIFLLLFALRLSSKLNMFVGVPNASLEILPPHLGYLTTYFGPRRLSAALAISIVAILCFTGWIGFEAFSAVPNSAEAIGASLLFAFAALGALEHIFLALPFRDGALWGWALPTRRPGVGVPQ